MITQIKEFLKALILNWSFIFGILTTTVTLSDYIFGDDNLYEEIVEFANRIITGQNIDLSPKTPQKNDLIDLIDKDKLMLMR